MLDEVIIQMSQIMKFFDFEAFGGLSLIINLLNIKLTSSYFFIGFFKSNLFYHCSKYFYHCTINPPKLQLYKFELKKCNNFQVGSE